jgi:hypothetical protein
MQFPMLGFRQTMSITRNNSAKNEQEVGFFIYLLDRGAIPPGKQSYVFWSSMFEIDIHLMHKLYIFSGADSVVQKPWSGLLWILQALVFQCFQTDFREEKTLSWKRYNA